LVKQIDCTFNNNNNTVMATLTSRFNSDAPLAADGTSIRITPETAKRIMKKAAAVSRCSEDATVIGAVLIETLVREMVDAIGEYRERYSFPATRRITDTQVRGALSQHRILTRVYEGHIGAQEPQGQRKSSSATHVSTSEPEIESEPEPDVVESKPEHSDVTSEPCHPKRQVVNHPVQKNTISKYHPPLDEWIESGIGHTEDMDWLNDSDSDL
jgi:hypothetical protein